MLDQAYRRLTKGTSSDRTPLNVDCAHGVGALKIPLQAKSLSDILNIEIFNTGDGVLNYKCGAEHVQKSRTLPLGINNLYLILI